jgi:DNA-directed RNA polymerase alpha subunit
MTKEEMLDHFATHAMVALIEKMGVTSPFNLAQTSYSVATSMLENRRRILAEWKRDEENARQLEINDLHELGLPVRYFRCLTAEGIYTKEKLCEWTLRDVRRIPNLGLRRC